LNILTFVTSAITIFFYSVNLIGYLFGDDSYLLYRQYKKLEQQKEKKLNSRKEKKKIEIKPLLEQNKFDQKMELRFKK
jgi:hypothetical protein